MRVRVRGEHQQPYMHRWRLKRPGAPVRAGDGHVHKRETGRGADAGGRARWASRARLAASVILALLGAGAVGYWARPVPAARQPSPYPPTPRAWFDAYMAAAVDDPGRVCTVLFSPGLAARYARTGQRSCLAYFQRVSD
jgi:hypothetical protein